MEFNGSFFSLVFSRAIYIVLKIGQQYSPIGNSVSIEIPDNLILSLFIYELIEWNVQYFRH